jgi:hypothetical protein
MLNFANNVNGNIGVANLQQCLSARLASLTFLQILSPFIILSVIYFLY